MRRSGCRGAATGSGSSGSTRRWRSAGCMTEVMRSAVVAHPESGEIAPGVFAIVQADGAGDEPPAGGSRVNFAGDLRLTELPAGLMASSLNLSGCTALRELPEGLHVRR